MATLRELRQQRGFTQQQLAAMAEVAEATIQNAERGRTVPRPAILRRLARALQVDSLTIEFPTRQVAD